MIETVTATATNENENENKIIDEKELFLNTLYGDLFESYKGFIETRDFIPEKDKPKCTFHSSIKSVLDYKEQGQCYFGVNPRNTNRKGNEANIKFIVALYADLDGDEVQQLKKLAAIPYSPTIVIGSGHGIHAYWILKEPAEVNKSTKAINKGITNRLEADHCFDLCRILRLPGTINSKVADKPTKVRILQFNPDNKYNLDTFEMYADYSGDDLIQELSPQSIDYLKGLKQHLACVQDLLSNSIKKDGSFNLAMLNLVCYFKRKGCSKADVSKNQELIAFAKNAVKFTTKDEAGRLRQISSVANSVYDLTNKKPYNFGCGAIKSLGTKENPIACDKNCKFNRTATGLSILDNKYMAKRFEGKGVFTYEEISNFIIKIIAMHDTPDGLIREIIFIQENSVESKPYFLAAEDMDNEHFKIFCFAAGQYIWRGMPTDLTDLWEQEFLNAKDMKFIYEPDHIGYIEKEKIWLFANIAITNDGEEIKPDENGVFWIKDKGIKPQSLVLTNGDDVVNSGIPSLNLSPFDIKTEFKTKVSETIGENQAKLCLGWLVAVLFLRDIFKIIGCFFFLFLHGLKGSGKTKLLTWLLACLGVEGEGYAIESTTVVAMGRYVSYYSSLPVLFDDYRNTEKIKTKDSFLRNVYNQQSAGKGLKTNFGVRDVRVRGTVCFTGEEEPHDGALQERCAGIEVSENLRTKENLTWFARNRSQFSFFAYDILKNKKSLLKKIKDKLEDEKFKKYFTGDSHENRPAAHNSVIYACYAAYFGEDLKFKEWLQKQTAETTKDNKSESMVSRLLDDLMPLRLAKKIRINEHWAFDSEKIYLYLHGIYYEWEKDYRSRHGEMPFAEKAIRDYIKNEPGFLELGYNHRMMTSDTVVSCVVFNLKNCAQKIKNFLGIEKDDLTTENK